MQAISLRDNWVFHDENPYAEPLFVDSNGRILRFTLKPGQSVQEHTAPNSPVYIVVLKGSGLFSGGDEEKQQFGAGALLVFDIGEKHAIHAEDEELVFIAFLHGVPEAPWHRGGGAEE
jgi:quercetin dioxygenase-like cupin family protein